MLTSACNFDVKQNLFFPAIGFQLILNFEEGLHLWMGEKKVERS